MAHMENPPFERGATFYNGATIDTSNLAGLNIEGTIWEFPDLDYSQQGAKPARTNRTVKCMAVRNKSADVILPKRLVTLQLSGTFYTSRVNGYACTTACRAFPVDEFISSAGCPVNDICWIVLEGPATVMTDLAGAVTNVFAVGDAVVALTAATSGATTSGRVAPQDLTGATALLANQVQNLIGYALSAKTTTQTNGDLLIDTFKWGG